MKTKARRFTPYFEWCERQDGSDCKIGITDFAQQTLGEIVYIELPTVGDTVKKDAPCLFIESRKAVVDILAPLSGVVVEVNRQLLTCPNNINQSPYDKGWLISIRLTNEQEWDGLLTQESSSTN